MRVNFVKKARKAIPGVCEVGESYYWWTFRYGGKRCSKTYPRPSQLTSNSKKAEALAASENLADALSAAATVEDLESAIEECKSTLENVIDEYEESISNLEEHFPNGCPALEEQTEAMEQVESFCAEFDGLCFDEDDSVDELKEQIQSVLETFSL